MNTLLIVSGGIEVVPAIQHAKKMGLHVIVSDGNPNAPGIKFADDFIIASTYDVDDTVKKVKKYDKNIRNINGVICIAADIPLTVSTIANELGLPSISVESSKLSMDKILMKNKFYEDSIPIPNYSEIHDLLDLEKFLERNDFPVVLKPADNCGARGVSVIHEEEKLEWAFLNSKKNSKSGRVLVEEFLYGPQISTESIILDGECHTIGFADRNYEYLEKFAPYIIENGGELPSFLDFETQLAVNKIIEKASISMGVLNGVVKGDIVIFKNQPYIIEIATRLSGGYFCSHEIPLSTGVDFIGNAIKMCMGESIDVQDLKPKHHKFISQRYLFTRDGVIDSIEGINLLEQNPKIKFFNIHIEPGQKVFNATNHRSRAGMVIASGDSRENAIFNAVSAINDIKINYQD